MTDNIFKQIVIGVTGSVENIATGISKISLSQKIFKENLDNDYEITSRKALSEDWKNIGNDMRKGILKYDRSITR